MDRISRRKQGKRLSKGIALFSLGSQNVDLALGVEEDTLKLVASHSVKSRGFQGGLITHPQEFAECIVACLEACEKEANLRAIEAHAALSCKGFHFDEVQDSVFVGGVIRKGDIQKLVQGLSTTHSPHQQRVINDEIVDYAIDGHWGARHPEGLFAHSLAVRMVRQSLEKAIVINLGRLFDDIHLPLVSIMSSSEAAGEALLSAEERDLGALIIDIGAQTSSTVIFHRGVAVAKKTIGYGGQIITQDIARGLGIERKQAETIKLRYGDVGHGSYDQLGEVAIRRWSGTMEERDTVPQRKVNHIIRARCKEIFHAVARMIEDTKEYSKCAMVCHICGRTSSLLGIDEVAQQYLSVPARKGWIIQEGGRRYPVTIVGMSRLVMRRASMPFRGHIALQESWFRRLQHWLRFQE